jgi:hypothetical protein
VGARYRDRRTGGPLAADSDGRGNRLLELAGQVAPIVFVFGYLLILATLMHRRSCVCPTGRRHHHRDFSLVRGRGADALVGLVALRHGRTGRR